MKNLGVISICCLFLFPAFMLATRTANPDSETRITKPTPPKTGSPSKPRSTTGKSTASKPKQSPTPKSTPDEKGDYDTAEAMPNAGQRVAALRKFLADFPNSERRLPAMELIVKSEAELGNASTQSGDLPAASVAFKQAAMDAPKPVSDQLFTDTLSKFSANLFWHGERDAAFQIARILEEKCSTNTKQLLVIAGFYMSVESGAEAKRVANNAIALEPNSSVAYQALGLANRIDFQLDESAAAYAKALELEPESLSARRGLAELNRSLGKPDEAAELYRQILAKDDANLPARTGLILSLFDAGKRSDAEAEMSRSLEANPGNVMLLAEAAYWYASQNEGQKAIDLGQKAIDTDPRFIWSHIAVARGYLLLQKPLDAERTLLGARRYGNFPTLEYEIASARAMAGLYREAAEELTKSFTVKDGVISTKLGGRIQRESTDFTELLAMERRASISARTAADTPENSTRLRALLDLWIKLESKDSDADTLGNAVEEFVRGDDNMKLHRQLYAANELLDRKKALPKVIELTKAAVANVDSALEVPSPSFAVMADELYDSRRLALSKDEVIKSPEVPRSTLLAIIRGRIEELSGWALFQMENTPESIVRLKRAVSVLPTASAWWRTSFWRLGTALEADGKGADALDAYIKSYQSGTPDVIRYSIIATLYKRIKGDTNGLETKIGPNPAPAVAPETVSRKIDSTPVPEATPFSVPVATPLPMVSASDQKTIVGVPKIEPKTEPTPVSAEAVPKPKTVPVTVKADPTPEPTPVVAKADPTPEPTPVQAKVEHTTEPTPVAIRVDPTPEPTQVTTKVNPTPEPTTVSVIADRKHEPTSGTARVESTPELTAVAIRVDPTSETAPMAAKAEPAAEPSPSQTALSLKAEPRPEPAKESVTASLAAETAKHITNAETTGSLTQSDEKVAVVMGHTNKTQDEKMTDNAKNTETNLASSPKELFPPVLITIPAQADANGNTPKNAEPTFEPKHAPQEKIQSEDSKSDEAKTDQKNSKETANPADSRPRIVPTEMSEKQACSLTLSEESLTLQNNGGDLAVIVGTEDDRDISSVKATSNSPNDVDVRLEPISGIKGRALFVVRSVSTKPGIYQVTFTLPCGKKDLSVKVR